MERILPVIALIFISLSLPAQEQKAAFDISQAQDSELGLPSPMDKFLGLDAALGSKGVKWGDVYREVASNADLKSLTAETDVCLALGVRIADGIMAVKAQDANALNECASDIEALAKKLKVAESQLERAKKTRALANKGQWLLVFWEMGCLQVDILQSLSEKGNEKRRTLIIASGWLQGAHYAAHVINQRYTPELSNYLREPMLVKAMSKEMQALPTATQQNARVAKLSSALGDIYSIVNIPLDGTIAKPDVQRMADLAQKLSGEFVQ